MEDTGGNSGARRASSCWRTGSLVAIVSAVDVQGVLSVVSNAADPIALSTNVLGDVTINGSNPGTGAFPSTLVTSVNIQGGPGANLINFSGFQIASFPVPRTSTVDGGGGNDDLVAPAASTDYYVTGPDAGILGGAAFGSIAVSTFTTIPNLTGGSAANDFVFSPGASLSGAIEGGPSLDVLDVSSLNDPLPTSLTGSNSHGFQGTASFLGNGFDNIATLNGPVGQGTLSGDNVASTWTLTGTPTDLMAPTRWPSRASRRFKLATAAMTSRSSTTRSSRSPPTCSEEVATTRSISRQPHSSSATSSAGGEVDTLNYTGFGSSVNVQLTGSDASGYSGTEPLSFSGGGFQGIQFIIASPSSAGSSILTGDDSQSTWSLGAAQTYNDGSPKPRLTFSGFGILQSGAGANTFNVTSDTTADLQGGALGNSFILGTGIVLTGTIDGQAGLRHEPVELCNRPDRQPHRLRCHGLLLVISRAAQRFRSPAASQQSTTSSPALEITACTAGMSPAPGVSATPKPTTMARPP